MNKIVFVEGASSPMYYPDTYLVAYDNLCANGASMHELLMLGFKYDFKEEIFKEKVNKAYLSM